MLATLKCGKSNCRGNYLEPQILTNRNKLDKLAVILYTKGGTTDIFEHVNFNSFYFVVCVYGKI